MPTLVEQFDATNARLDALISPPAADEAKKLTVAEALAAISAELGKATVTKERAAYLKSVLGGLSKSSFEQTSVVELKVLSSPDQIKPTTTVTPVTSLASAEPVTAFASLLAKAQAIQKLLVAGPSEIKKSKLTDKLDEIKALFQISDEELKNEYDLRWKIGDLISLLQNAIKLEQLVGDGAPATGTELTTTSAAKAATTPPTELAWPADMASAKFDPAAGVFKNEPPAWGQDKHA